MSGSTRFTLPPAVRRTVIAMLFAVAMFALPTSAGADQPGVAPNAIGAPP